MQANAMRRRLSQEAVRPLRRPYKADAAPPPDELVPRTNVRLSDIAATPRPPRDLSATIQPSGSTTLTNKLAFSEKNNKNIDIVIFRKTAKLVNFYETTTAKSTF